MKRDEKSEKKLHNLLQTCPFFSDAFCCDSLSSTNDLAKELAAKESPQGTLVLAEAQTMGRGRMGRRFFSPRGDGLYMSLILRPERNQQNPGLLTACAAVAVYRAILKLTKISVQIKWVNDLYFDGKKLCGILAEGQVGTSGELDCVILGIGLNLQRPKEGYAEEIEGKTVSLAEMTAEASVPDRLTLCAGIVREFAAIYQAFPETDFLEDFRNASCVIGQRISYWQKGEQKEGEALSIDEQAGLVVRTDDGGTETLGTGEISLVRPLL